MPAIPESPDEIEARRENQRAEQRTVLEHLPEWLRIAHLRQKDVAEALGVSEGTVSNWIAGRQQMSVGQLRQIALLLRADPGDVLRAPSDRGLSARVEETLSLMDRLDEEEWNAVLQTARSIAKAKRSG
jgi:transcriptional regulator with XRE-family HTH domain